VFEGEKVVIEELTTSPNGVAEGTCKEKGIYDKSLNICIKGGWMVVRYLQGYSSFVLLSILYSFELPEIERRQKSR
jgi:hypothetical protein